MWPPDGEVASPVPPWGKVPSVQNPAIPKSFMPLLAPAALNREVPYTLKPEELKELEDFRARHGSMRPALSVAGDRKAVSVLVPEGRDPSQPIIFDIRIEHMQVARPASKN